ncbi:MAG: hypothetical protein N3F07_01915 [Candidatus Micrarchaeota archaeon]|nr:hypothetical protein [Candidatus Micrarchaeota archaeon]
MIGMRILKEKALKKGNGSIAMGCLLGLGSLSCPCPACLLPAFAFFADGIRRKFL